MDHLKIVELCRSALRFVSPYADPSRQIKLNDSATFICKIWDGHLTDQLSSEISQVFGKVHVIKPDASRENSAEIYLYSKKIKKR